MELYLHVQISRFMKTCSKPTKQFHKKKSKYDTKFGTTVFYLSPKIQNVCQPDQDSETFLSEWSRLRRLLLFGKNSLSKDQDGYNLEAMDKQHLGKDSSSILNPFPKFWLILQ